MLVSHKSKKLCFEHHLLLISLCSLMFNLTMAAPEGANTVIQGHLVKAKPRIAIAGLAIESSTFPRHARMKRPFMPNMERMYFPFILFYQLILPCVAEQPGFLLWLVTPCRGGRLPGKRMNHWSKRLWIRSKNTYPMTVSFSIFMER